MPASDPPSPRASPGAAPSLDWAPWLEQHPLAHFVYDALTLRHLAVNAAALLRYACSRDEFLSLKRTTVTLRLAAAAAGGSGRPCGATPAVMAGRQAQARETPHGPALASPELRCPGGFVPQPGCGSLVTY